MVLFHMLIGSSIHQQFESLSQWSPRCLWTYHILHRYLYLNVDMSYEKFVVYIVINSYKTRYSELLVVHVIIYLIAKLHNQHPKILSSLPKYILLEPYTTLSRPNFNNYKPYLPRQMNKAPTLIQPYYFYHALCNPKKDENLFLKDVLCRTKMLFTETQQSGKSTAQILPYS